MNILPALLLSGLTQDAGAVFPAFFRIWNQRPPIEPVG